MKVFCIIEGEWEEEKKYIISLFNHWADCEGPGYGDVVTVTGTFYEKGELYYLLLEWPPKEPTDGYLAECFIPLSEEINAIETERVREKVNHPTLELVNK